MKITRRDFVAGTAASSAAYALGPGIASAKPGASGPYDVAIVGAGAAGIGAGQVLRKAGKRYVILEALDRIGGRTFTETHSFPGTGIRWDLGAQWYHFVTPKLNGTDKTNNPLFDIAVSKHYDVFPDDGPRFLCDAPKPKVNLLDTDAPVTLAAMASDVVAAGLGSSLGITKDVSALAATADLRDQQYYQLVAGLINGAVGAWNRLSSEDLFDEIQGGALLPPVVPSYDNWLTPPGLGTLVVSLARGLNIRKNSPVRTIRWRDNKTVVLETPHQNFEARTVIVTASLGALDAETLAFRPDLPAGYQNAIHKQLKMGYTAKIPLLYDSGYRFPVPQPNSFASLNVDTQQNVIVHLQAFGHKNFAIVIGSGENILAAERRGQLVQFGRDQIRTMFGGTADNAFKKGVATTWNTNKYFLGGFSHAIPGGVPGRRKLAEPVRNRLGKNQIFFAGEAVSVVQHSSAPGAYTTGREAAAKALKALRG